MTDHIKVTVSDSETGEELESRLLDDDYMVICAGDRFVSSVQAYGTGTHVVTVKREEARR